jgi:flagellar protein FlaI
MDKAKVNQIMRNAMVMYSERKENYDNYLQSRIVQFQNQNMSQFENSFVSENNINKNNSSHIGGSSEQYLQKIANNTNGLNNSGSPQYNQNLPQYPSNQPQPMANQGQPDMTGSQAPMNMNMSGGGINNSAPINIIAKNYINPESFEESETISNVHTEVSKKSSLAKLPDKLLKESGSDWEPINYRGVDDTYDLYELSKVKIKFDDIEQKILYEIIEPELTKDEQEKLDYLKNAFIYVFDKVSPEQITVSGKELIIDRTRKLAAKYRLKFTEDEFNKITYYLVRDFLGLDILEPIMHDKYIEDVSCDGLGVPIFVNHLKYGPLEVNRKYTNILKLNSFIVKLAQKSNKEVSLSKPILQGALPDGSRVEAIYGKEISEKGSNYTIRKFRAEPFTPIHLMEFGTVPPFLLAYLWLAVENKQSILVSGGTATGKTTTLNALSLFVPPTAKIVSIEDTPEINLPHEHWLSLVSKETDNKSQVTMFDLLKASLRERPDYIIVGEIRGSEAAILFQGMATGHAGMGTVHAEKFDDLVNRMVIEPINLPVQLITELDIVIFIKQMKVKGNVVRRVTSVVEVIDYNKTKDKFTINEFVKFKAADDEYIYTDSSATLTHLLEIRGGKEEALWAEIEKRRRILDLMHKKKILEFDNVSEVILAYHKDPANILEYVENYTKHLTRGNIVDATVNEIDKRLKESNEDKKNN